MSQQTQQLAVLPALPYDYGALEPHISGKIMELHHTKHHQAYVNNFNVACEKYAEAEDKRNFEGMLAQSGALKFNGGGHINHSIFWSILAPTNAGGGGAPQGKLAEEISRHFGSFENFVDLMSKRAVAVQGSGWAWLGVHRDSKKLVITTTANQDPLCSMCDGKLHALFGIDVWEHAYYLQYENVRPNYVKAIWNLFNWKEIQRRFEEV